MVTEDVLDDTGVGVDAGTLVFGVLVDALAVTGVRGGALGVSSALFGGFDTDLGVGLAAAIGQK